MLADSKGMHGHFSPKAVELYVAALRLQALIQAGFGSARNILEMDEEQVVMDLQRDEPNWLIEGALIE